MQLRGKEGEPFHEARALHRLGRRRQAGLRVLIGDEGKDRDVLGEKRAVVELQRRHVALRVQPAEIPAMLGPVRLQVDPFEVQRQAFLLGRDVRGQ